MLRVLEERLTRGIRDRPNASRAQQSAEGSANAFIVIDNGDIDGCGATHRKEMSTIAAAARW